MVVVLTGGNYNNALANQVFGIVSNYIITAALPEMANQDFDQVVSDSLDVYAGSYRQGDIQFMVKNSQDRLYIKTATTKPSRIYPIGPNMFLCPSTRYGDARITFHRDESGKVTEMTWEKYLRSFELTKNR